MRFILLLISLTFCSCQKYYCPGFDKEHPINKWDWFPESSKTYTYINTTQQEIELQQTRYASTPEREVSCNTCACFQDVTSYYSIGTLGIQLRCTLSYQGGGDDKTTDDGSLYYGVDKLGSPFTAHAQTVTEDEIPPYEFKEFNVIYSDSLRINNKLFFTVTELQILDNTKTTLQKLWIAPNQGLIGFRVHNQDWIKK
ncbi:MAG: hypothetical protein K1X91_00580 [Bacteriodetes bacterium]|nr:hypothetical protein [Bacteroidota bacterium]